MILPDFVLPSKINKQLKFSGLDSPEHCSDKAWFYQYPHRVEYKFNNRGYRDHDWPDSLDDLKKSIWCVGDSFTTGVGSPFAHIWPRVLQKLSGTRTINVSMDGASNMWIARKSIRILEEIEPAYLIIHWSYISRREAELEHVASGYWDKFYNDIRDPSWPDCAWKNRDLLPEAIQQEINLLHGEITVPDDERLIYLNRCSDQEDIDNTLECIARVDSYQCSTQIVHGFIPGFVPLKFQGVVESGITGLVIPELPKLDLARDGHHYDVKTSSFLCQQIVDLLNL